MGVARGASGAPVSKAVAIPGAGAVAVALQPWHRPRLRQQAQG